jgi:hypothetical protein
MLGLEYLVGLARRQRLLVQIVQSLAEETTVF